MAFDLGSAKPVKFDLNSANPVETKEEAGQRYRDLFKVGGARKAGQELPSAAQGGLAALQGPLFGFADEVAGAGSAFAGLTQGDTNVAGNYRQGRDFVRGATTQAQQDRPVLTAATQFAASTPLMMVGGGQPAAAGALPMSIGRQSAAAAKPAFGYGALSGAGNSEANTAAGVAGDAMLGGTTSAVLAGGSVPIARGMGAAGKPVIAAINDKFSRNYAREKAVEALIRDADGAYFQGQGNPIDQALARLGRLGPDARVVDAGNKNARGLLDVVANAPGRTGPAVERVIRQRQTARAGNLVTGAQDALGVAGSYVDDLANFTAQREMAAAPLYAAAFDGAPPIVIPKDILLRDSVQAAYRRAQQMAGERGVTLPAMNPNAVQPIPPLTLRQADFLKKAMDDVLYGAKMPESNVGKNAYGLMQDTRAALVASIDDQAGPLYAKARAAFAGPTQAMEAAELGRNLLKEDATEIPALIRGLTADQREALKIGTVQGVKDMVGTQAGQTKLLKLWANPGMRERLQLVFGKDFRAFQRAILAEERKKAVEQVGRGSQTAARQFAADDLDTPAAMEAAQAATGGIRGLVDLAQRQMARIQTPEPVRDEIGRILLSSGPQARNMLAELSQYVPQVNAARAARADTAGRFAGLAFPGLIVSP